MQTVKNRGGRAVQIALTLAIILGVSVAQSQTLFPQPPPGSVYRDFSRVMYGNELRITTPEAAANYPDRVGVDINLPNPWIGIDGIVTANAIKAELIITMWGGHIGTYPKWFCINYDTDTKYYVPELRNTPTDPQCYGGFYNVALEIPVSKVTSSTAIQGDAGTQTCWWFGWPQWLWYGVIMRVYYDPSQVAHPNGVITSPTTGSAFSDNPTISVSTAGGGVEANRVDVIAYYDSYDVDGDGVSQAYQLDYHAVTTTYEMDISNHVGTATGSGPTFQIPWSTTWLPNQAPGSVKMMARVRGTNGVWYVTPEITGLTFNRQDGTVRLFKPKNVPEHYWARDNNWVGSQADVTTLTDATQAFLLVRTWNGYDGRHKDPNPSLPITSVNGNNLGVRYGRDHNYSFDMLSIPTGYLTTGTNSIQFWADSKDDHGVEVMWPGPALLVKYAGGNPPTVPDPPTLVSPMDGATGVSLNPALSWSSVSNADSYKLQVSSDAGFTSLVADLAGLTETTRAVGPLNTETVYYWRLRATNAVGDGGWSATRSFTSRGATAQAPWWNSAWRYRIPISVPAGAYDRYDKPVEMGVNFTSALSSLGASGALDQGSLRLIEVSEGGGTLDTTMACQFDRGAGYDASTNASGTVVFIMKGLTAAGTTRNFHLYFETAGSGAPSSPISPEIAFTDNVDFEGQSSFKIQSAGATWYYHKQGGGFAGMKDRENREWLGYHPYGGSDGAYRGIPNMVFNTSGSDFFHPGFVNSTSSLISAGPVKVSFRTKSTEPLDPWECVWDVYPDYARMTLVARGRAGYWFLYEGTPGGSFEASSDYVVRSTGSRTAASVSWEGDVASPEWVYFGDGGIRRVLYLVNHEADTQPDSYRQQDGLMTVFGFGRSLSDLYGYMNDSPRTFTVGFAEDSAYAVTSKVIASASRDISASPGIAERLVGTPVLVAPANGTASAPTSVALRWRKVDGVSGYHLQVSTDPNFLSGLTVNDSSLTDTTYQASGLQAATGYSWRVRAIAGSGKGAYSVTWQFTTATGVGAPQLLLPAQGAVGLPTTVNFHWSRVAGASRYVFELATDSTFGSGIVKYDSTLTDTTRSVAGLLQSRTYYWRVGTRDAGGLPGGSSETRTFRTAGTLPSTVTLLSPADGAVVPAGDVSLRWNTSVPGVTRYWVEVAMDSLFALRTVDSLVVDTTKTLTGLASNTRYWWKVRGRNAEGWGGFSAVRTFVLGSTGVASEDGLPSEIFLDQNYPNPFNPSTIIRFGVPGESRVRLEVFTILGERVATLVDGTMGAGIYSVTFNVERGAGGVAAGSSGIYFYRLSVGADVRTRKMLILK